MPKRSEPKNADSIVDLTPEVVEYGLIIFAKLATEFEILSKGKKAKIDIEHLESLTKRFIRGVAQVYGMGSIHYIQLKHWPAYQGTFFYGDPDPADYILTLPEQEQYELRNSAQKTLSEIQALINELELRRRISAPSNDSKPCDLELVLQLCRRLPNAAKVLTDRRKQPKRTPPSFPIQNEYDAQDLLHAILRAYFKDSIQEEPLGQVAAVSSRADLGIKDIETVIELKYVRGPNDQKRIVEEFSADTQLYTACTWMKALDVLAGPIDIRGQKFQVHIIRC